MSHPQKRKFNDSGFDAAERGKKQFCYDLHREKDILTAAPRELRVLNYVQAHVAEIEYLNNAIERDLDGKTTPQRLPRQMQRRAMGHNIKRLPRSVRAFARPQYDNQQEKKKKLSRYHRRRPKNLLQEYTRRQRKHIWLETHIWHAKRFHMVEKWGFKIPWKPTEKSERACYRATSRHCLLQDQSYMCCIEITGDQGAILTGLAHVTSTSTGSTFAAKSCLSGTREGQTMVYKYDSYPYGAIAPVTFTWRPMTSSCDLPVTMTTHQRQLWVWCHPSSFDQIWKELEKCLDMTDVIGNESVITDEKTDVSESKDNKIKAKKCENEKQETQKKFICYKFRASAKNGNLHLTMKSLTGSILRFRLTGPQSGSVLFDALQQANIVPGSLTDQSKIWWKHHYAQAEAALAHGEQREVIEKMKECQSPSELPPHCVVGFTVRDPRLNRPERRTMVKSQETEICGDVSVCKEKITPDVSISPLWDADIREQVASTKMSDFAMNESKSENLVPGTPLNLGDAESRIPVILIQRPGSTSAMSVSSGRGSGWDVLLPEGWAMPFWLSLVFRGARCGGMKENESIAFENGTLVFPNEFPDTEAGRVEIEEQEKAAVAKFNRRPPAKRSNFNKFGVVSPFSCPWTWLVEECNASKEGGETAVHDKYYVLRDSKILRRLKSLGENGRTNSGRTKVQVEHLKETINELHTRHSRALIPVRIEMVQRGAMGQFSMICLPSENDLMKLEKDRDYGGPLEPKHVDPLEVEKKKMKKDVKDKNIKKKIKVDRRLTVVAEKDNMMVRNCSRDVIGYLTSGGFSLGCGSGAGKGFVSALGLAELLKGSEVPQKCKGTVIVRSTTSLQYRFGKLTVLS